jgi:amidophosphoribosyltransferase
MCGICGIIQTGTTKSECGNILYNATIALQHRGQDAVGFATPDNCQRKIGLVRDAFPLGFPWCADTSMALSHNRYQTKGDSSIDNVQPFLDESLGIAFVHNGQVTATEDSHGLFHAVCDGLRQHVPFVSLCCSIANRFAHDGAYTICFIHRDLGLFALQDPHAIRPLSMSISNDKSTVMVASESCAFLHADLSSIGNLGPGECIHVSTDGFIRRERYTQHISLKPCLFEYVYLARPDSIIHGVEVYKARCEMGRRYECV